MQLFLYFSSIIHFVFVLKKKTFDEIFIVFKWLSIERFLECKTDKKMFSNEKFMIGMQSKTIKSS
jgi:hypothetical protein